MQGKGQMYLTTEQIQRLAALSLDALSGVEFTSDCADNTEVTGYYVLVDNPSGMEYFSINPDGTYTTNR